MDFTDPFVGMAPRKLTDAELAKAIRLDMAAELDAINLYQSHLESTDNPVARRMIKHIMDEEKDHLEEFAQLLYTLDPTQAAAVTEARHDFQSVAGGTPADTDQPPATGGLPEGSVPAVLTVGSLKA